MSIRLKKANKHYQSGEVTVHALKNADLAIENGEIAVILGPSGSGKSTLMNIIGGIDKADSGQVEVEGNSLHSLQEKKLVEFRRKTTGFIFQSYNLIPVLTVKENVEAGAEISSRPLSVQDILRSVGMEDKADMLPHQLSGGEQQRTAIARAIVKNPQLLLCDEPTGALDEATGKKILALLQEINLTYKTTIIIITHNQGIAEMGHRVIRMKSGEVAEVKVNSSPLQAEQVEWV
ncbi:ABC transporter ATP-binding protein [Metabacillus sp. GX 13764]|uniref:ABC transporter ATP-binding protein n=1 Tax=Metabacillus kandeliae TaxID=2900151 RepID=UPI001E3EDB15|nr:ABC transporter ATP-binding protein [Metabacillus kandeliae]MCD7033255.1 ABC transporter ATP-binding protein [Metabacillus kandeliae]